MCGAGQRWAWEGVTFEVLHPGPRDLERAGKGYVGPNAVSCVLKVSAAGRSVLLTGDIEAPQEWALRQIWGEALRSEVLVVPHHGSKTSSTEDFLPRRSSRGGPDADGAGTTATAIRTPACWHATMR